MSYADRILDYLWSISPAGATNEQLVQQLGITSHQTVYMATQQLLTQHRIRGERVGRT
jgi:hypothetical protein